MSAASVATPLAGLSGLTPIASDAHVSPEEVVFESRGCVLVLGDDAQAGEVAQQVAKNHGHFTVVFAPGVDVRDWGPRVTAVGRRVTHLKGYLGAFHAGIQVGEELTDIGAASPNPGRCFDLVLDLGAQALITDEVKPYGYFATGADEALRQQAIATLSTLVGRFSKAKYFSYAAELCAHSSRGLTGCTRCLDVCSAAAIHSVDGSIRVDPHLCQGCASCALSCPTGALIFKVPERQTLGDRLQAVLADAGHGVTLILHAFDVDAQTQAQWSQCNAVSFQVNPLPAFGDELWMRALALGVGRLVLLEDGSLHGKTLRLFSSRVAQMQILLQAIGESTDRLAMVKSEALPDWLREAAAVKVLPLVASRVASLQFWAKFKRLAWIDGLRQMAGNFSASTVVLAPEAPIGAVQVDANRCTLCFACVNLCPTRAVNARHDTLQQLVFQESACVQCGLCVKACPEQALSLQARFAPAALARMTSVVLHQDEQFKCTSCGTPFINRRLLESSLERIKDHPVLAQGGRAALMTCPSCRQKEMLEM